MKRLLPIVLLAGCATSPQGFDPSRLTPEQIKATVADKSTTVSCGLLTSVYGRGVAVYVNLDAERPPVAGTVTVDSECKTTVTMSPAASAPR